MCGKSDEPRIEPTVMVNLANELRILFEETMSSHRNNFVSLSREKICRRKMLMTVIQDEIYFFSNSQFRIETFDDNIFIASKLLQNCLR